jgi:hypothetical protein
LSHKCGCVLGENYSDFQVIIIHNFTKICHLNLLSMSYHRLKLGADKMKDSWPWCTFCVLGAPRTPWRCLDAPWQNNIFNIIHLCCSIGPMVFRMCNVPIWREFEHRVTFVSFSTINNLGWEKFSYKKKKWVFCKYLCNYVLKAC